MQKYVNLVDLVKSFPTSIYLQKSASIQPRTSLSKFGGTFNSFFIRLLNEVFWAGVLYCLQLYALAFAWLFEDPAVRAKLAVVFSAGVCGPFLAGVPG